MEAPLPNLKMVIIIPCLAETGIRETVGSLRQNSDFDFMVECLVVVNHSELASPDVISLNKEIFESLLIDKGILDTDNLKFIPIEAFNLPHKKAGVGMARKIGMDLGVNRLKQAGTFKEGILVCLDGDCTVQENYVSEIEKYLTVNNANGCSIYFEHPLDGENSSGIIDYELFLRYYTDVLRWCGFPYAFQTVGSSMAVSATAYEKQGGMNTRKAGEDFYFLNKIIQLDRFGDLTTTTVFPSPRKSERVPFGTGREMMEWESKKQLLAYHPSLFIELRKIFKVIDALRDCENPTRLLADSEIHPAFISYLEYEQFNDAVLEARFHTSTLSAFRKRFLVWMNAFRIMKLLNELSISNFPKLPIHDCVTWLWKEISNESAIQDSQPLLFQFRKFDRTNHKSIGF